MDRARSTLALMVGLTVSCSLDWTVGAAPDASRDAGGSAGHGGAGGSSGASDSAIDRTPPPMDAATDTVHPTDVGPDVSCSALLAAVDQDRFAAQECSASSCKSTVVDQCGCAVVVAQPSSTATAAYVAAIDALKASGCPPECGTCPKRVPYACLPVYVKDAGLMSVCTPS
jgi:hypothetical protein